MFGNRRQTEDNEQFRTKGSKQDEDIMGSNQEEVIEDESQNRSLSSISSEEVKYLTLSECDKFQKRMSFDFNSSSYTKHLFDEIYQTNNQVLGDGAQGKVMRCFHKKNKKTFAVKHGTLKTELMEKLPKIINNLVKINHRNILRMNELYLDQNIKKYYQVMEYLPFKDLDKQIKNGDSYNIIKPKIKNIMRQLFLGLEYLHQRNMVHNDIKPQNILYDPSSETLKIIDFGLLGKTEKQGKKQYLYQYGIKGTIAYMSPQMIKNEEYCESIDVWAAGVTLYQLVQRKNPFYDQQIQNTFQNIRKIKWQFNEQLWSKQNNLDLALNLLKHIFTPHQDRLTAKQALKNIYFASFNKSELSRQIHPINDVSQNNQQKSQFSRQRFTKSGQYKPTFDIAQNGQEINSIQFFNFTKKSSTLSTISLQTCPSLTQSQQYQRLKIPLINNNNQ